MWLCTKHAVRTVQETHIQTEIEKQLLFEAAWCVNKHLRALQPNKTNFPGSTNTLGPLVTLAFSFLWRNRSINMSPLVMTTRPCSNKWPTSALASGERRTGEEHKLPSLVQKSHAKEPISCERAPAALKINKILFFFFLNLISLCLHSHPLRNNLQKQLCLSNFIILFYPTQCSLAALWFGSCRFSFGATTASIGVLPHYFVGFLAVFYSF